MQNAIRPKQTVAGLRAVRYLTNKCHLILKGLAFNALFHAEIIMHARSNSSLWTYLRDFIIMNWFVANFMVKKKKKNAL